MDWNNITLKQFYELTELNSNMDVTDLVRERFRIIFGENIDELNIAEYSRKVKELDFISTPIKKGKVKTKYIINGHEYELMTNPFMMSAGQYLDFTVTAQNEHKDEDLLSILFIPKGAKYNDGSYSMDTVKEDMLSLPITDVVTLGDFFFRLLRSWKRLFQTFLKLKIWKMKRKATTEKEKEVLRKLMSVMDSYYII